MPATANQTITSYYHKLKNLTKMNVVGQLNYVHMD